MQFIKVLKMASSSDSALGREQSKKRDDLADLLSFVCVHLKYFSWHELHMLTEQQSSISS